MIWMLKQKIKRATDALIAVSQNGQSGSLLDEMVWTMYIHLRLKTDLWYIVSEMKFNILLEYFINSIFVNIRKGTEGRQTTQMTPGGHPVTSSNRDTCGWYKNGPNDYNNIL